MCDILGTSMLLIALLPANVGSWNCILGYYSEKLRKIKDAYLVAAWTGLYSHMYRGDYASAQGRYESCKCFDLYGLQYILQPFHA